MSYLYGKNFNSSNSENKAQDVHVIEYSYDRNSLFLELAYDQTYLGTKIFLTKYKYFQMAFNVNQKVKNGLLAGSTSDSQGLTTTGNSAFHPTVMFSFNMRNPINLKKQKKKEKIMPVAVDEYSFLEMERGLI